MSSSCRIKRLAIGAGLLAASGLAAQPAAAREFRVCADPNNLPYSKQDGSGFENKIAEILADQLGEKLTYTWFEQRRTFLRSTLNIGRCDVVMGLPTVMREELTSRPYYRSSYVFVQPAGAKPITSFDDPRLKTMKIGVQLTGEANTPPVQDLAARGIRDNVKGYMVFGNTASGAPLSPIVKAVADHDVDVSIVWGPIAGYFATRVGAPLELTPVLFDPSHIYLKMTYDISVAVRKDDTDLISRINDALRERSADIAAVLKDYGVPRLDNQTQLGEAQ